VLTTVVIHEKKEIDNHEFGTKADNPTGREEMLGFLYAWPAGVNQHQIQERDTREYNYPGVQLSPASAHFGRTPGSLFGN